MQIEQRTPIPPTELTSRPQWLVWRHQNGTKIPYQINGQYGKSNDSSTWCSFEQAKLAFGFDGVAYVISGDDEFCGIDLDDCLTDGKVNNPEVDEILRKFTNVAYCEISPSGDGLKLTTKARKPSGAKCQYKKTINVECYDSNRFWTVTGRVWDGQSTIADGQKAVDWLIEKYLKAERIEPTQGYQSASSDVLARAMRYAAKFPPASEGSRNNDAFRHAGNLLAITDEYGRRPSKDQVFLVLSLWNETNQPPIDAKELRNCIESASKNGTPRQDKPDQSIRIPSLDHIDISGILDEGSERQEDDDDNEFYATMVPEFGLIKDIYEYYMRSAFMPCPVYAMSTAIAACQTIFGRKIASSSNLRTNDYHLILGGSCAGKEAATQTIINLFAMAGCDQLIIPDDVTGATAILDCLEENPASIWVCDEFGVVLSDILDKRSRDPFIKSISKALLKLYGKSQGFYTGGAQAGKKRRHKIAQPHLCVIGAGTSDTVFKEISEEQVHDGLLGRIAFWQVREDPEDNMNQDRREPTAAIERIRDWANYSPGSGNLSSVFAEAVPFCFTDEAKDRWQEHRQKIKDRKRQERTVRGALWGRTAARSMNLALTHRAARLEQGTAEISEFSMPMIELQDVEWGIKISNWMTRLACSLIRATVEDKKGDNLKKSIVAFIRTEKRPVTQTELMKRFKKEQAADIRAIMSELQEAGPVLANKRNTKGRPVMEYAWNPSYSA